MPPGGRARLHRLPPAHGARRRFVGAPTPSPCPGRALFPPRPAPTRDHRQRAPRLQEKWPMCRRRRQSGRARAPPTSPVAAPRAAPVEGPGAVGSLLRRLLAAPVATLEPVDPPAGVNELLLAGVEGMALRAQ